MRGEVLLLSSNVEVTGSAGAEADLNNINPYPWGCHILVADFFEPSDLTYRAGSVIMDNVGIYNCSQAETYFSAISF